MPTISKYAAYHTAITTGYTNPSNAYADDGVYATAAPAKNAEVSAYFGFPAFTTDEIPDGVIINSVTTGFKYHVSTTASIATQYWQTFKGTTGLGTEQSDASEPLTDVIKTHQVTSGITLSDLRSNDVARIRLRSVRGNSNTAVTFYIDYAKITIDYTPAVVGAVSLSGLGSLSASGLLTKIGNVILTGLGSLSSVATIIYNAQATLSGIGSLTAQGIKTIFGQVSLAGQGLLSAVGEVVSAAYVYGSATLIGAGQLVASSAKIILGQVQLVGQGILSAIGTLIKQASAVLSGLGSLTASGVKIIIGQADLIGQGILSATGNLIQTASAILSGTGSLIASGIKTIFAQAVLVGQGTLTAVGKLVSTAIKAIKNISLSKYIKIKNISSSKHIKF